MPDFLTDLLTDLPDVPLSEDGHFTNRFLPVVAWQRGPPGVWMTRMLRRAMMFPPLDFGLMISDCGIEEHFLSSNPKSAIP